MRGTVGADRTPGRGRGRRGGRHRTIQGRGHGRGHRRGVEEAVCGMEAAEEGRHREITGDGIVRRENYHREAGGEGVRAIAVIAVAAEVEAEDAGSGMWRTGYKSRKAHYQYGTRISDAHWMCACRCHLTAGLGEMKLFQRTLWRRSMSTC